LFPSNSEARIVVPGIFPSHYPLLIAVRHAAKWLLLQKKILNGLLMRDFLWRTLSLSVLIAGPKVMDDLNVTSPLKVKSFPHTMLTPLSSCRVIHLRWVVRERTAPTVCCINCGEEGHRMRDCTVERRQFEERGSTLCRNCGSPPTHLII